MLAFLLAFSFYFSSLFKFFLSFFPSSWQYEKMDITSKTQIEVKTSLLGLSGVFKFFF